MEGYVIPVVDYIHDDGVPPHSTRMALHLVTLKVRSGPPLSFVENLLHPRLRTHEGDQNRRLWTFRVRVRVEGRGKVMVRSRVRVGRVRLNVRVRVKVRMWVRVRIRVRVGVRIRVPKTSLIQMT